ncbi:MAG: GNAT family N-acetyltransferase [Pseudomonadota bacterium]
MCTPHAIADLGLGVTIAEGDPNDAAAIEGELLRSLRSALPQSENTSIVLIIDNGSDGLVGGLTASTSYGWMLVKTLWIAESERGKGYARALMRNAEERARALGCHGAWLDTSNPAARRFYAQLGYQSFGQLENADGQHPPSHRRWFMKKHLTD